MRAYSPKDLHSPGSLSQPSHSPAVKLVPPDHRCTLIYPPRAGPGWFSTLNWPAAAPDVKEYLLISEDPDAPLPSPTIHGIYYGIPPSMIGVGEGDIGPAKPQGEYKLKGVFKYGKNRRGTIYIPPRPLPCHGPHRYFFTYFDCTQ